MSPQKTLNILILVPMLWSVVLSQSDDCTKVIISMSPCLNYITGNSSVPSVACCTQLDTVVRTQPQCLCKVLNGGGSNMGLNIDQAQALELPKTCKVQTPPVSRCNAAASPSGSPSTPNSPKTNPSSGGISRTVPLAGDGSSDAASSKLFVPVTILAVFIVSYVSTFNMA
ncbi:non-specific lipid transfer protein GPI-anchored 26-like [Primulina eburnea]|uniref:non-specific lipid transfer protein GPI-anchored 26-like n=1 Tax=Primulina eburnea TaxID=1245227 RepID=UPI003C6CACE4